MKDDDEALLYGYNEGLELTARLLKLMGCDDVKQATPEQINLIVDILMAPLGLAGAKLTAKQIMADHRKLSGLKRRRQQ
jgi:hypothetical protein